MSFVSLGMLIVISLMKPQDNLFSWQMILGVIGFTVLLFLVFVIWKKVCAKINKASWLFTLLTVLFGLSLFIVSCIGRNDPASSDDYGRVWNAAQSLARGEEIQDAYYLMNYSNNIKPMLLLYLTFKLAISIGLDDPFYIILLINVIGVIASIIGIQYLLDNDKGRRFSIPIIGCYLCCLPIWAMTQTFYTDAMSISISVVIIALAKKVLSCESKKTSILLCFLMGIILTLGISIKVTILIPVIAASMVYFLMRNGSLNKQIFGYLGCVLVSFVISYIIFNIWSNTFEITKASKLTEDPVITWIGLGLKADGSFHGNKDYIYTVHGFETKAEKLEYCKAYIRDNFRYFFNGEHIVAKIRCTYASGHLGSAEFSFIAKNKDNILWQLFSPWGKFYWRASQIGFCYLHALFSVCFFGNIVTVYRFIKSKEVSKTLMMLDLSILGYFIFLLIWEANNRQLYNMLPILIGAAILNGNHIIDFFMSLRKSNNNQKG